MFNQRGYSILELLMVVVIIGILSMVAMTEYNKVHNRAYVGAAMNDLQVVRQSLSMYDAEWGTFPMDPANSVVQLAAMLVDPLGQPYMNQPSSRNFDQFTYIPPGGGDIYGDYNLIVICNDHWRTQILVHGNHDVETFRTN
jgi:prepilin-type N-terminal cleavage/methylation domain-containing protein